MIVVRLNQEHNDARDIHDLQVIADLMESADLDTAVDGFIAGETYPIVGSTQEVWQFSYRTREPMIISGHISCCAIVEYSMRKQSFGG